MIGKEKRMVRQGRSMIAAVCMVAVVSVAETIYDQAALERRLYFLSLPRDNLTLEEADAPAVPKRNRDAMRDGFSRFVVHGGWTTNQVIEGLIFVATNNIADANWATGHNRDKAASAFCALCDINHPMVTNFFRSVNNTDIRGFQGMTLPGLVQYSHLEPELLDYLKGFCVQTNIYDRIATHMMMEMFECYNTLPEAEKPAAKMRLAKYMYFAIRNVTDSQGWQDEELSRFVPSYSNSLQRLETMRYVSLSATNTWERSNASQIVQYLSSLPTNQLSDVSWIAQ